MTKFSNFLKPSNLISTPFIIFYVMILYNKYKSKNNQYLCLHKIKKRLQNYLDKISKYTDFLRIDFIYDELNDKVYFNECEIWVCNIHTTNDKLSNMNNKLINNYKKIIEEKNKYNLYFNSESKIEFNSKIFYDNINKFLVKSIQNSN